MTLARYFVFRQDETWIVGFEGQVMAYFPLQSDALDRARGMANLMGAMHYDADVMLEDEGRLSQIWVYGQDQLPPPSRRKRGRTNPDAPVVPIIPRDHSLAVLPTLN